MYFDRAATVPLFVEYRTTNQRRNELLARLEHLTATATARRRRRRQSGGAHKDENLVRTKTELEKIQRRYDELKERIAVVAYAVAENYWPKFFRKGRRLSADATSVAVPSTERDDCIQTAVAKVVTVAHRYEPTRGSLLGFVTEICKNEFLGVIRKVQQKEVNHIRHVESYYGREEEIETHDAEPEEEEPAIEIITPDWSARRPTSMYASYGAGDERAVIRFAFRPPKQRVCDMPTLAKYLERRRAG